MTSITIIGVGPGDPDLLTLKARDALQEADVVAGFETVLKPVSRWIKGEARSMRYRDQDEQLDYVAKMANEGKRCVVCAWGDLNFSARELLDRVRQRVDHVELIPGISSVQVACARLGLEMEKSIFVTLHARGANEDTLREAVDFIKSGRRNVILLPRPFDLMPAGIAKLMIEQGVDAETAVDVLQRLSLEDESIQKYSLASLAESSKEFSDLSIMVFPL